MGVFRRWPVGQRSRADIMYHLQVIVPRPFPLGTHNVSSMQEITSAPASPSASPIYGSRFSRTWISVFMGTSTTPSHSMPLSTIYNNSASAFMPTDLPPSNTDAVLTSDHDHVICPQKRALGNSYSSAYTYLAALVSRLPLRRYARI